MVDMCALHQHSALACGTHPITKSILYFNPGDVFMHEWPDYMINYCNLCTNLRQLSYLKLRFNTKSQLFIFNRDGQGQGQGTNPNPNTKSNPNPNYYRNPNPNTMHMIIPSR